MPAAAATLGNKVSLTFDRSTALDDLNAAFERSGQADKTLAGECRVSPSIFSRMRAGALAFGVDRLDDVPRAIRVEFYRRQLAREGYETRPIDPVEVSEELLAGIESLARIAKLARLGRAKPVKVGE